MSSLREVELEWEYVPGRTLPGLDYLARHERVVGPLIELALQAAHLAAPEAVLADVQLVRPIELSRRQLIRVVLAPNSDELKAMEVRAVPDSASVYLRARVSAASYAVGQRRVDDVDRSASEPVRVRPNGSEIWQFDEVISRIEATESRIEAFIKDLPDAATFRVHPALIDALWLIIQPLIQTRELVPLLAVGIREIRVLHPGATASRVTVLRNTVGSREMFDVTGYSGESVAFVIHGMQIDSLPAEPAVDARSLVRSRELAELIAAARTNLRVEVCERFVGRVIGPARGRALLPAESDLPFRDLGLTSLHAVQIAEALSIAMGAELPATLLFDHPTVGQLARALVKVAPAQRPHHNGSTRAEARQPGQSNDIAVVGVGCRFPGGAVDLETFERLLVQRTKTFRDWPTKGAAVDWISRASLLNDVAAFDAGFFGISPPESRAMDPQHRLLLEVSWEALEHAGIRPSDLDPVATGVFVGLSSNDYVELFDQVDGFTGIGNARAGAAGRISYHLGLRGPTVVIDTACSSSLAAVHMACASLLSGEITTAVCGGVNLILSNRTTTALQRLGALSHTGECNPFSDRADGYVRGEGCAVIVMKTLASAVADGDRILGVIRGSAMNHDGRSNGFSAPSGQAQEEVMRRALARSRLTPADIGYVEAHGTGTPLGDSIEVRSIAQVYSERGLREPVRIGSVKANIGHLEAAAGIAGLIKALLVVMRGRAFAQPALPEFRWLVDQTGPVRMSLAEGPACEGCAAVSSFGLSGTNVHVIVGASPVLAQPVAAEKPAALLVVSAKGVESLEARLRRMSEWFTRHENTSLRDACWTAAVHREHFENRAAIVASNRAECLQALAERSHAARSRADRPRVRTSGVLFAFGGHGSHWPRMGRELLEVEPVFSEALHACDAELQRWFGFSIVTEVSASDGALARGDVAIVQPAVFSIQVALARLWISWGIRPEAVVGHSMGEVAAAHVAGILSLADAACVIACRSQALTRIAGKGTMLFAEVAIDRARAALGERAGVWIAAVDGPQSLIFSGGRRELEQLAEEFSSEGVYVRWVRSECAGHCPQVDFARPVFEHDLALLQPHAGEIPMYSTVTAQRCDDVALDASYWFQNLREQVRFGDAIDTALRDDYASTIEVSPHPVLIGSLEEAYQRASKTGLVVHSMARGKAELATMYGSLGSLFEHGVDPDWTAVLARGNVCELPNYSWRTTPYWIGKSPSRSIDEQADNPRAPLRASFDAEPDAELPATGEHARDDQLARADDLLQFVRTEVAAVMHCEPTRIDERASLVELGMDSVTAHALRSRIWSKTRILIPIGRLFAQPTIADITRALTAPTSRQESSGDAIFNDAVGQAAWDDAMLDPGILPSSVRAPRDGAIFLTGATGFFGSNLLKELLEQSRSDVYCLVRATDTSSAYERLRESARAYGLPEPHQDRVRPVIGDLERPRFSLDERVFSELAHRVSLIVHNGANVDFLKSYSALRAANVIGTREAIRLACEGRAKPIHYVSTIAVAAAAAANHGHPLPNEETALPSPGRLRQGYSQTKWVSEQLVREARQRGIEASILRPGFLIANSSNGLMPAGDVFAATLSTIVNMRGQFRTDDARIPHLTPVDAAARAAVLLMLRASPGGVHHLAAGQVVTMNQLFDWIEGFGITLAAMEYWDWWAQAFGPTSAFALAPFEHLFDRDRFDSTVVPHVDCRLTDRTLEQFGFTWPAIDRRHIHAMLQRIVRNQSAWPGTLAAS